MKHVRRFLVYTTIIACIPFILVAKSQPREIIGIPQSAMNASMSKVAATEVKLSTNDFVVNTRAAKTFVKKECLNPATGRPTPKDSIISFETTSNGQTKTIRMKASEYYDQINSTEKGYNELGYSIYDNPDGAPVVIQQMKTVPSVYTSQTNAAPVPIAPAKSSSQLSAKYGVSSMATVPKTTVVMKPSAIAKPTVIDHVKDNHWEFGEKSSFQASLDVHLKSHGEFFKPDTKNTTATNTYSQFHADGSADAYVLNQHVSVLEATSDFKNPADNKPVTAKAEIKVLGQHVWGFEETGKDFWDKSDDFKKTLKYEVPFRVPVGPIAVKGVVGITGTAGMKYDVAVRRDGISGSVTPYLNVTGYGEAGVDILVAGAGVGASLTLCDANLTLSSSAKVKWSGNNLNLEDDFNLSYSVEFLSGRMYCFAYVMVPQFSLTNPIKKKRFEHDFFKWGGYTKSGELVDISKTIPVS